MTLVPKTEAFAGAPNAAKSVTTLRGGECEGVGIVVLVVVAGTEMEDVGEEGLRAGR